MMATGRMVSPTGRLANRRDDGSPGSRAIVSVMSAPDAAVHVRRATRADLPALGRLGAHLVRVHLEFDWRRFVVPTGNLEAGYAQFLGTQLDADDAIVFVADRAGASVGYVYAGIEPFSWKELREAAGFVYDIVVDEGERRTASPER